MTWNNFKCILVSEREQPGKYVLCSYTCMTFWKMKSKDEFTMKTGCLKLDGEKDGL